MPNEKQARMKLALPAVNPLWSATILLVAADLMPLVGLLAWGWSFFQVMFLFWAEAVMFGVIIVLKLVFSYPGQLVLWIIKPLMLPFVMLALLPYGFFMIILTVFVFASTEGRSMGHDLRSILLSGSASGGPAHGLLTFDAAVRDLHDQVGWKLGFPLATIVAAHLVSFAWYYFVQGECNRATLSALVFRPLQRGFLMLNGFMLAAFGLAVFGAPLWLLVPLIVVKTATDVFSKPDVTPAPAPAPAPAKP